jgi:hypothetical protein
MCERAPRISSAAPAICSRLDPSSVRRSNRSITCRERCWSLSSSGAPVRRRRTRRSLRTSALGYRSRGDIRLLRRPCRRTAAGRSGPGWPASRPNRCRGLRQHRHAGVAVRCRGPGSTAIQTPLVPTSRGHFHDISAISDRVSHPKSPSRVRQSPSGCNEAHVGAIFAPGSLVCTRNGAGNAPEGVRRAPPRHPVPACRGAATSTGRPSRRDCSQAIATHIAAKSADGEHGFARAP